jgi:hypothetical protein
VAHPNAAARAEQAARNNAIWCDTICRAHGVQGEFHGQLWLNRQPVPRFYPNAVTFANPIFEAIGQLRVWVRAGEPG